MLLLDRIHIGAEAFHKHHLLWALHGICIRARCKPKDINYVKRPQEQTQRAVCVFSKSFCRNCNFLNP